MNKKRNNTQTPPILDLVITRQNYPTISKLVKATKSKVESIKKSLIDCEPGV